MAVLAAPMLAQAAPLNTFYERTVMTAADQRCGLFQPAIGVALAAGRVQARNTALRAGADNLAIAATERRAWDKVGQTPCNSPDLVKAASRVETAFAGFSKMTQLVYPGDLAGWRADRGVGRTARWRLAQDASFGWDKMTFGLAGKEGQGALMAVASFADGRVPYAARLVMRDADRSLGPYLDLRGASVDGRLPLARRMPPDAGLKAFAAEARSVAGQDLARKEAKTAWAFRFPAEAARRLSALDPREAVAVEFVFAGQTDTVRRAYVEVGDFAPGRAFLQMTER
jgi:hypothetical protein